MKHTVCEIFAGIGEWRIGFNHVTLTNDIIHEQNKWNFVYSLQYESSMKKQNAFQCYQQRFGNSPTHINKHISDININDIPKHNVLVINCVQHSFDEIMILCSIIKYHQPAFIIFKSLEKLLSQNNKKYFSLLLQKLSSLQYTVEWRMINAAEYGFTQRRKRLFIFCSHNTNQYTNQYLTKSCETIFTDGFFSSIFPIQALDDVINFNINNFNEKNHIFNKTGYMINNIVYTTNVTPEYIYPIDIVDILSHVQDTSFYLTGKQLNSLKKNKKAQIILRQYSQYTEGIVSFPDNLDMPARTLTTYEGTVNRSAHVVEDPLTKQYRFLTPTECEKIQMLPYQWTSMLSTRQRYFVIGKSSVIGVLQSIGDELYNIIQNED